jgi:quinol monooxygenase YgiN
MGKIIFQINYEVKPEKRDDYLRMIKDLKEHLSNGAIQYMVTEDRNKNNNFTEVYICENEEQFESLEGNNDDKAYEITNKLYTEFLVDNKANYNTLYELD